MSTSRGLTALFYGPPGTGKSMVAGLVARELGLDLYRVDLARIVSKWIGETEKNLAEVFDAAEDGQVVILFDEADSLFAKRTEVKSSVDRYANLEVNYLLQRLDTFEGVAVLTTNLEGSIDQAFKRRMSLRLHFPFPDEDMRVRLWAAHIPTATPIAGDFDFKDLAKRFPLSGGYIRNSTLRGAFLAAQENRPLAPGAPACARSRSSTARWASWRPAAGTPSRRTPRTASSSPTPATSAIAALDASVRVGTSNSRSS
jgi:SpoVK/Ycf46/Vps4 family AAA+-type ATPase